VVIKIRVTESGGTSKETPSKNIISLDFIWITPLPLLDEFE